MAQIYKQPLAEQDLIDIWLYSFKAWGEMQADKYLDDLDDAFKLLDQQPLLCRERLEFNPPIRIHRHAHHLIVYRVSKGAINILRVLHESMDLDGQLSEADGA